MLDSCRDRAKSLSEALFKLDKSMGVMTRKRSRSDVSPSERSNVSLPGDRSVSGGSINKMGSQSHILNSANYEPGSQKPEDRTKNAVPNRRVRTSMVDVRVCIPELIFLCICYLFIYFINALYLLMFYLVKKLPKRKNRSVLSSYFEEITFEMTVVGSGTGWYKPKPTSTHTYPALYLTCAVTGLCCDTKPTL